MKRKMSERQMWLHIAKCIKAKSSDGIYFRVAGYFCRGLCLAIAALSESKLISDKVTRSAHGKVAKSGFTDYYPYVWAVGDMRSRRRFCLKQAKLLEKKKKPTSR